MSAPFAAEELERFRHLVTRHLGLAFDDAKLADLREVFRRRLEATRKGVRHYLVSYDAAFTVEEQRALAAELTVSETYFFRNLDQIRAFGELALPARAALAHSTRRRLRILSAGCSSGEEPYTLAIVARERLGETAGDLDITAIDINPVALAKARRGRYTAWSLRETPAAIEQRWFSKEGNEYVLDPRARQLVAFEERGFFGGDTVWSPASYDVVFCRNVIMYFAPERAREVLGKIWRALMPGGFLFLGHAETPRGLSKDFHLCHTHGTFYYQRKEHGGAGAPEVGPIVVPAPAIVELAESAAWVDVIRGASERIESLVDRPAETENAASTASARRPALDISVAIDRLREERFEDALRVLHALPPESARDPDVLLLRAVLLTHSGETALAERTCEELLRQDELSAGAHYLLALCREAEGDRAGAIEHDRVAAYLDPDFAMPHVHLGLLARKERDLEAARRELGQGLVLLEREEPSRLLFYGGGFKREALIALCRAELAAVGGLR